MRTFQTTLTIVLRMVHHVKDIPFNNLDTKVDYI